MKKIVLGFFLAIAALLFMGQTSGVMTTADLVWRSDFLSAIGGVGFATNSTNAAYAGTARFASNAGVAGYSSNSGAASNLVGTPSVTTLLVSNGIWFASNGQVYMTNGNINVTGGAIQVGTLQIPAGTGQLQFGATLTNARQSVISNDNELVTAGAVFRFDDYRMTNYSQWTRFSLDTNITGANVSSYKAEIDIKKDGTNWFALVRIYLILGSTINIASGYQAISISGLTFYDFEGFTATMVGQPAPAIAASAPGSSTINYRNQSATESDDHVMINGGPVRLKDKPSFAP